jgi:hypothetical protein
MVPIKRQKRSCFLLSSLLLVIVSCKGQPLIGAAYLPLQRTIEMPHVRGRIDHMDANVKEGMVYVAALGNNTLEVADIHNGRLVHEITGLHEPQGVGYIPRQHEILVANGGNGACDFFSADGYKKRATIQLGSDADDVRVDPVNNLIFVGYGDGGIAVMDAARHQLLYRIPLPAHPEGFQLDGPWHQLFVNIPDAHEIAVIDLQKQQVISHWKTDAGANFPMAIDTVNQRVFIGYRHPAQISVLDAHSGKVMTHFPAVGDMDDLYFDAASHQLLVSGGQGAIEVYQEQDHHFIKMVHVAVRSGARTSLYLPSRRWFVLAERATSKEADLLVYKLEDK